MADSTVKVSFLGDATSLKRAADESDGALGKLSHSIGDFAKKAAIGVAAGVGALAVFSKSAVSAASDLAESQSKVSVVFGEQAKEIEKWASKSATAFGQSKQQALEAAGTYGNLFQAFGVGQKQSAQMSTSLVQLAADLASFNNTSVDDALSALRSGLSGETEPLKRFGVAINDDRLKAEALRLGLIKTTKEALTPGAKAQAAYALIMKDTALAQGDFARTSDGLANKQRILKARFADLQAEIGTKLLPVATTLAGFVADKLLPAFERLANRLAPIFAEIAGGFRAFVAAFKAGDGDITSAGFPGFMERVGLIARDVFDWMKKNVPPVLNAIAGFLREHVIPAIQDLAGWVRDDLAPAVEKMANSFKKEVWPVLEEKVLPTLKKLAEFIRDEVLPVLGKIVVFIFEKLLPALFKIIRWVADDLIPTLADITVKVWHFVGEFKDSIESLVKFFVGVGQAIARPFVKAFNLIADAWNNTVAQIPQASFGIGPIGISTPKIGTIPKIPEFATGGVMPGPRGAPGLAVLHGGETVLPTHGGGMTVVLTIDGREFGRATVDALKAFESLNGPIPVTVR